MAGEGTFRIAFWILLGGVLLMRAYFGVQVHRAGERIMPDRAAVEREGRAAFVIRLIAFFLLIGWLGLYAVNPIWIQNLFFPLPAWLRWMGFGLGLAGLGAWTWSQVALGSAWSAQLQLREAHHLVTSGPYARIRHPLYTAMWFWSAGLALVTACWVFVALALLVIVGLWLRVPREEQMLVERFGDEYREYMSRTGRFIPK